MIKHLKTKASILYNVPALGICLGSLSGKSRPDFQIYFIDMMKA